MKVLVPLRTANSHWFGKELSPSVSVPMINHNSDCTYAYQSDVSSHQSLQHPLESTNILKKDVAHSSECRNKHYRKRYNNPEDHCFNQIYSESLKAHTNICATASDAETFKVVSW